jgi:protein-tyrosine kinase
MPSRAHLIERAAERLVRGGGVPGYRPMESPGGASAVATNAEPPVATAPISLAQLRSAGLIADSGGRSRLAEELWLVQRQVLRLAFGARDGAAATPNLLMVTSTRPDEGKTFTALNLAGSIARQGDHPVLLIDADVKQQSLSDQMGQRDRLGLLDLVNDPTLDPGHALLATAIDGLCFLPIGRTRPAGSDLLSGRHATRLLQGLAQRNRDRLVMLDISPCLATSDPAALAPVAGQILFVVEAERTQRREVENALDLLQECRTITLLLNKMQQSAGQGFGAYSPYYLG